MASISTTKRPAPQLKPEQITVALDAGHGDTRGAVGYDPGVVNGSRHEAEAAMEFVLSVKEVLVSRGFKVVLTRDGKNGAKPDLRRRVTNAIRQGAKMFISVHYNMVKGGGLVYRSPGRASLLFAAILARALGLKRIWRSQESRHHGLYPDAFPDARPAVMLEVDGIENAPPKLAAGRAARLAKANQVADAVEVYFFGRVVTTKPVVE